MKAGEIFQFGKFQIDARVRTLRRETELVTLNYRAFDVLLYLVQNPGKALTRDELLKNVWHDTFVDEHNLAQNISVLRKALEEKPGDNNYIVTLPGRGYQFVSPVQVIAPDGLAVVPEAATVALQGGTGVLIQQQTIRTTKSRQLGFVGVELNARLELAELEMKTGQATAGRAHLTAIETDAKAKGYNLVARKAAAARG